MNEEYELDDTDYEMSIFLKELLEEASKLKES